MFVIQLRLGAERPISVIAVTNFVPYTCSFILVWRSGQLKEENKKYDSALNFLKDRTLEHKLTYRSDCSACVGPVVSIHYYFSRLNWFRQKHSWQPIDFVFFPILLLSIVYFMDSLTRTIAILPIQDILLNYWLNVNKYFTYKFQDSTRICYILFSFRQRRHNRWVVKQSPM